MVLFSKLVAAHGMIIFSLLIAENTREFYEIAGSPKVISAIDGTLIPTRVPHENKHLFVCHKGYQAITVMAVCDPNMTFTNIVAKWQVAAYDSAILNSSLLQIYLESGGGRDGWLLGDRGYALNPYMMTPSHPDKVVTNGEKYQKSTPKLEMSLQDVLVFLNNDSAV